MGYDSRQPRDDLGRWSSGSGGVSVGHALHVAKFEGIPVEYHTGIRQGIESGELNTREKVLAHIDAIHASALVSNKVPTLHEKILQYISQKGGKNGGELAAGLGADKKDVLAALSDLRSQGHTEKDRFNRDVITEKGKAEISSGVAESAGPLPSSITVPGGFKARLAMSSGSRTYSKEVQVSSVTLTKWTPPGGGDTRVYIKGTTEEGTSQQRGGGYDLGYVQMKGDKPEIHGGKDVKGNEVGVADEHISRILALASRMVTGGPRPSNEKMNAVIRSLAGK